MFFKTEIVTMDRLGIISSRLAWLYRYLRFHFERFTRAGLSPADIKTNDDRCFAAFSKRA